MPAPAEGTKGSFGRNSAVGAIDGLGSGFHLVVVPLPRFFQNVAHLVDPAALLPHPRIEGANRRRQAGAAVGENQSQRSALQPAPIEILEQGLPVGLAFALAAQKRQQMSAAVLPNAVG